MWVDTHAHLSDEKFDGDRDGAFQRAFEAGLGGIVEIACRENEWAPARALAEKYPGKVFWTIGIHPHYADEAKLDLERTVRDLLKHPQAAAVGEIGLDYFRNKVSVDIQKKTFSRLVRAALEADKPLVIHCRENSPDAVDAQKDTLEILKDLLPSLKGEDVRGVFHCFQGSLEFARRYMDMGFFVGVDGPLTYPNAGNLRALFKEIPLEKIVLETDSPYLPPQTWRGKRNEPAYLPAVAEALASLKGVSTEIVMKITTANAEKLYRVNFLK